MSAVAKALEPLDEIVQRRVISWAASRFGMLLLASGKLPGKEGQAVPNGESAREISENFVADRKMAKGRAPVATYPTPTRSSPAALT
jgi:hypothetical protein